MASQLSKELLCCGLLHREIPCSLKAKGERQGNALSKGIVQNFLGCGAELVLPASTAALPKMLSMLQVLVSQQTLTQNTVNKDFIVPPTAGEPLQHPNIPAQPRAGQSRPAHIPRGRE